MYTIEQIEDAYIAALVPLKTSLGVRTIQSYQGELDNEDEIARATKLFPAIILVYGGSAYSERGTRKDEKMRHLFFVCDKSFRAESAARRGGLENPGTYAMLNGMRDILYGQQLDLEITAISLIAENPVWFSKGVSIYSAEYETGQELVYKNRTVQTIK